MIWYIAVNSVYQDGIDYFVSLFWNNTNKAWINEIVEVSRTHERVLSFKPNPIGSYEKGKNYINFKFDLGTANYPEQYRLFFVAGASYFISNSDAGKQSAYSSECNLIDVTNLVAAPPPEFTISFSPNTLELRPVISWLRGIVNHTDERNIQLQIQSKTNLNAKASFVVPNNNPGIQTYLTSNQVSILPNGTSMTTLNVNASENAKPKFYSIPIVAYITLPQTFTVDIFGRQFTLNSNMVATITKNSTLGITVLKPLEPLEHIRNAANFVRPLLLTLTPIASVIIAGILWLKKYLKKPSKRNNKIDDYST